MHPIGCEGKCVYSRNVKALGKRGDGFHVGLECGEQRRVCKRHHNVGQAGIHHGGMQRAKSAFFQAIHGEQGGGIRIGELA